MVTMAKLRKLLSGGEESLIKQCEKIANIPSDNVQEVASILQKMIASYYVTVRRQALMAFWAALALEIVAVLFFVKAAQIAMTQNAGIVALSALSGSLIQIMTAVVFYLYSRSAKQFGGFHICLERTNRFLLANAMVEHLPESEQVVKRAEVITAVLNAPMLTLEIIERGA
jgi:hypothetical protein